jgi:hypothetical protein
MRTQDIVKTESRTELEAWERWMNRMQTELLQMGTHGKRVPIIQLYDTYQIFVSVK